MNGAVRVEMPKKQAPDWKLKAKKSDLSPKELQWQEKAREETLRKNFEARQRRAERAKAGDTLVVNAQLPLLRALKLGVSCCSRA